MKLILASASPRRAEILTNAGLAFETYSAAVDESRLPNESPVHMVERLALAKAQAVAGRLQIAEPAIVIGADTVVVRRRRCARQATHIRNCPGNAVSPQRPRARRDHRRGSRCSFPGAPRPFADAARVEHEITRVWFSPMSSREIEEYAATGEPLDKAGATPFKASRDALSLA